VVTKKSKDKWGGFDSNARVDVVINWKKAYRPKRIVTNKKGILDLWA